MNIVETAAGNPAFSTLVTALSAANLTSALGGTGPFTVFAPSNEAFAKLMLSLQNPERSTSPAQTETQGTARQAFLDYMALSPEQKIREKMLREMGLSLEEYEALPPEKKELIDKQIAQQMKEEMEIKSMAKFQPMQQTALAHQALEGSQSLLTDRESNKEKKDPLG